MVKKMNPLIIFLVCIAVVVAAVCYGKKSAKSSDYATIANYEDMRILFPSAAQEITSKTDKAIVDARATVDAIVALPAHARTRENTLDTFDRLIAVSDLAILRNAFGALEMISMQEPIRTAAHNAVQQMNNFWVDHVENNRPLYLVLKEYAYSDDARDLDEEQAYFLEKILEDFKRGGLELPEDKRKRVAELKKDLAKLSQDFELAIASDNRTITVGIDDLKGLSKEFIATLQPTPDGSFKLGVDYPTYFAVMENCTVPETRKKLYRAFSNRAYPINETNLALVIAKRDELANILGFASYAHLDLDDQMAKNPERAQEFLDSLLARGFIKEEQEFERFVQDLPESVELREDGKLNPWDVALVKSDYKKKHFSIDEQEIAHYFPMEKTIDGLLDIYHQFFGIDFKQVSAQGFWHSDVRLIEVYDTATKKLLGYLLLDLFPRPHKFTHACNITIVPAVATSDNNPPAVSLVLANFPKPTKTQPSLLKRDDVNTFFHEFGHALHGLLGRTRVASFSGTSVKSDFVEMPSQMLEEWLWDKQMLAKISSHYETGNPLSEDLIDKILGLKHFDSGYWILRQLFFAKLSFDYFKPGAKKDLFKDLESLYMSTMPHVGFDHENHTYASFGHLMGYGAKYYGYLWSKVFALDLFNEIKKHGLLNPIIGQKYIKDVIGRGGSQDPNVLLENFLGRAPNQDAFFKDLGL